MAGSYNRTDILSLMLQAAPAKRGQQLPHWFYLALLTAFSFALYWEIFTYNTFGPETPLFFMSNHLQSFRQMTKSYTYVTLMWYRPTGFALPYWIIEQFFSWHNLVAWKFIHFWTVIGAGSRGLLAGGALPRRQPSRRIVERHVLYRSAEPLRRGHGSGGVRFPPHPAHHPLRRRIPARHTRFRPPFSSADNGLLAPLRGRRHGEGNAARHPRLSPARVPSRHAIRKQRRTGRHLGFAANCSASCRSSPCFPPTTFSTSRRSPREHSSIPGHTVTPPTGA